MTIEAYSNNVKYRIGDEIQDKKTGNFYIITCINLGEQDKIKDICCLSKDASDFKKFVPKNIDKTGNYFPKVYKFIKELNA